MPRDVDLVFLERVEGRRLKGYVPRARDGSPLGRSGVTIATGADIGQWSVEEIERLILSPELNKKLKPYAGMRGQRAVQILTERPLTVSDSEAHAIDAAIHARIIDELARKFKFSSGAEFDDLPRAVQTVLASLAINFGPGQLATMAKTWSLISSRDWHGLADWLDVFPSKQPELSARRRREARLLRSAFA